MFHGRSVSEVSIPLPVTFSGVDKKLTGLSVDQVAGLVGQLPQGPTSQGSFQDVHFQVVSLVILGLVRKETGIVECRSIQRLPKFVADTLRTKLTENSVRQPPQAAQPAGSRVARVDTTWKDRCRDTMCR